MLGHPLSFLVRRIDNPKIEELIDRARAHRGNRSIDKRFAAREMLKILQTGGTTRESWSISTLWTAKRSFVDFFGIPAATTFMVAKLALRTGAEVLPVFAPWDKSKQKFLLKVGPALSFEGTGEEQEDVRRFDQAFTTVVEDYVRRYPDQWLWIHRRWKTRASRRSRDLLDCGNRGQYHPPQRGGSKKQCGMQIRTINPSAHADGPDLMTTQNPKPIFVQH